MMYIDNEIDDMIDISGISSDDLIHELNCRGEEYRVIYNLGNFINPEFSRLSDSDKYICLSEMLNKSPYDFEEIKSELNRILEKGRSERTEAKPKNTDE